MARWAELFVRELTDGEAAHLLTQASTHVSLSARAHLQARPWTTTPLTDVAAGSFHLTDTPKRGPFPQLCMPKWPRVRSAAFPSEVQLYHAHTRHDLAFSL